MAGVAETIRGGDALAMLPTFRESLQSALTTETDVPWQTETGGLPLLVAPPPLAEVENYAASRWNAILHYLVGSPDAPEPDPQMIELLVSTRLLAPGKASDALLLDAEDAGPAASPTSSKPSSSPTAGPGAGAGAGAGASSSSSGAVGAADGAAAVAAATSGQRKRMTFAEIVSSGGGNVFITRAGYEFLLRDTSVQLWTFINEYLRTATSRGMKVRRAFSLCGQYLISSASTWACMMLTFCCCSRSRHPLTCFTFCSSPASHLSRACHHTVSLPRLSVCPCR